MHQDLWPELKVKNPKLFRTSQVHDPVKVYVHLQQNLLLSQAKQSENLNINFTLTKRAACIHNKRQWKNFYKSRQNMEKKQTKWEISERKGYENVHKAMCVILCHAKWTKRKGDGKIREKYSWKTLCYSQNFYRFFFSLFRPTGCLSLLFSSHSPLEWMCVFIDMNRTGRKCPWDQFRVSILVSFLGLSINTIYDSSSSLNCCCYFRLHKLIFSLLMMRLVESFPWFIE